MSPPRPFSFFPRFAHGRARGLLLLGLCVLAAALAGGWWWNKQRSSDGATTGSQASQSGRGGRGGRFAGAATQPVSVGEVRREDLRVRVSAIGSMSARATAVVRARVSGELTALHFKEGDEVKAGALLAQIDPRSYEAALGQVQGTLARDEALLANARMDLARYRELQQQNSIAGQQVDTQAAQVRQLEGTVAAGRAARDAARLQLSYTRITAPIAGRLGLRQADRGNVITPGDANGIVSITQTRPIDAVFSVPESLLPQITPRMAAGVPLPVELWDREMRRRLATGRVSALDNTIDTATGSIRIKAAFANEDGALFPNQFVNVVLQLDTLAGVLTVPSTAVQNGHVYVVQPDGSVAYTTVRTGVKDGERVSVEGELPVGAQVVTDGLDRLRDGAKVMVIAPPAPQGAPSSAPVAQARRFDPSTLPPELREKLAKMSPEERRAFIAARRAKAAASRPAEAGPAPASTPASAVRP
ncbi:MAG: MdtA/MuxA family multidrug efflux RND transporter periplasmic adaptor subunit [Simplicispira suum]|uniref:MdtA/MuxA family multidrug efflux RND transporter periplasmic adaptor subunit n=1 Tax=Simplicispira suum TaxID=2109915 RepID=UPI001C6CC3E5|nr:MdtA/MuxA family multidrug efflux RND transporter periplasmic adaptor subunit [Simplicispira suum]MBW7833079.1 MdtA/MuxA family multidrug efflux RND transporter periplasmic adaptor subunit [Simplicispira suum]